MKNYIFVTDDDGTNITYTITEDTKAAIKLDCSDPANAQVVLKTSVILSESETWTAKDCATQRSVSGTIYKAV